MLFAGAFVAFAILHTQSSPRERVVRRFLLHAELDAQTLHAAATVVQLMWRYRHEYSRSLLWKTGSGGTVFRPVSIVRPLLCCGAVN